MFSAPDKAEARAIVDKAKLDIQNVIGCIQAGLEFPAPRNNLYDRFMSNAVNPIFYRKFVKADAFTVSDACMLYLARHDLRRMNRLLKSEKYLQ